MRTGIMTDSIDINNHRYSNLDVFNGICILFVILAHCSWKPSERLILLFPFLIDMAVPGFMIISGFLFSKSFKRHEVNTISDAYDLSVVLSKVIRFTIPFAIAYIIEESALFVLEPSKFSIQQLFLGFLSGGIGPGGYYYPIMIQFIFFFPVIYRIVGKYKYKGFIGCILMNFLYELLQTAYSLNGECYRVLLFRYIAVIAFGCLLSLEEAKIKRSHYVIYCMIGICYIIICIYIGITPFITRYWTGTSFIACQYLFPIAAFLVMNKKMRFKPLELLGKTSYNIFLVQMVYFKYGIWITDKIIENRFVRMPINMFICVMAGVMFYYIETPLTHNINNRVKTLIINLDKRT